MLLVKCLMCPEVFQAKTPRARFCSSRCRMRASRAGVTASARPAPVIVTRDVPGGVEQAAQESLASMGQAGTPVGRTLLVLARRIDSGADTAGGLASLAREFRAGLAEVMAEGEPGESPLDMLRERRNRRLVEELFDYDGGAG